MIESYDITDDVFIRHVYDDDPEAIEPDDVSDPDDSSETPSEMDYEQVYFSTGSISSLIDPDFLDIMSALKTIRIKHNPE